MMTSLPIILSNIHNSSSSDCDIDSMCQSHPETTKGAMHDVLDFPQSSHSEDHVHFAIPEDLLMVHKESCNKSLTHAGILGKESRRSVATAVTAEISECCDASFESPPVSRGSPAVEIESSSGTPNPSEPPQPILRKKQVTFTTVQIRNYPIVLGDNPCCQYGPPIGLDWCYQSLPDIDLDDYENIRQGRRRVKPYQLVLGTIRRKQFLECAGITREQRKEVEREMSKIQRQRSMTQFCMPMDRVQSFLQSANRKTRRFFRRGQSGSRAMTT